MDREIEEVEIPSKKSIEKEFFNLFNDFRDYLVEFVDKTRELCISELVVKGQVKLFDGYSIGSVRIKNQGDVSCYLSTVGQGGYRLDPGEAIPFFVNSQVIVTTLSGATTLGFIKS